MKNMHVLVRGLKLKLALDKALIGRIQKGFDFLGYRFTASGLCGLAQKGIDNHHCCKGVQSAMPLKASIGGEGRRAAPS